ncbi:DUF368 domain-containing protein [Pseudoteredinibacter isoporae]|uniref:Putative membrane protein n=1 Tax=Pseudoteredinibacter isoporae TaxID=570281 RepID=A0A7X0JSE8_9GAMM|nr:DUF368 domain-containing protein [Pseudoteredinibacter isoporae]MBB6521450.1 putative membrane protein [Pseudoteredinibacter isoporae]
MPEFGNRRSAKQYAGLVAKGMAMGAADVVPGVSGGTVAFISGIYTELIDSLRSIKPGLVMTLFRQGPLAVWREVNGPFLAAVFGGIFLSVFSLAKLISAALTQYPIFIWSFFFGLILASAILLWRQISEHSLATMTALVLGAIAAYSVSKLGVNELEVSPLVLFGGGALAICAMILPGISGGFILLMLGLYQPVIDAIKNFEILNLLYVAAGAGIGLVAFSHVLSFLLHRFRALTMASLTGFLFGSLNLIWPWKHVISSRINSKGIEVPLLQENVLPSQFETLTGMSSHSLLASCFCAAGLLLVILLEKWGQKEQNS